MGKDRVGQCWESNKWSSIYLLSLRRILVLNPYLSFAEYFMGAALVINYLLPVLISEY